MDDGKIEIVGFWSSTFVSLYTCKVETFKVFFLVCCKPIRTPSGRKTVCNFQICGSPGWKSNIIPLYILIALPHLKCYRAKLPLRVGLIHVYSVGKLMNTCRIYTARIYEPYP